MYALHAVSLNPVSQSQWKLGRSETSKLCCLGHFDFRYLADSLYVDGRVFIFQEGVDITDTEHNQSAYPEFYLQFNFHTSMGHKRNHTQSLEPPPPLHPSSPSVSHTSLMTKLQSMYAPKF